MIEADSSCFLNRDYHLSVSCFVVADRTAIGTGDFLTSTTPDYRSVHEVDICGWIEDLQVIDKFIAKNDDVTQINLYIASDFLGVVRKIEKESKLVSMSTKLTPYLNNLLL